MRPRKTLATFSDGRGNYHFNSSSSLHCPEYEQIFPLNEQRCWHRSELTSHSEMEPLLFLFDPGKMKNDIKRECIQRLIQIKGCIYIWKWETLGNKSSKCPLEPRQREIRHFSQEDLLTITLIAPLCKHTVQTGLNCKHMTGMDLQELN